MDSSHAYTFAAKYNWKSVAFQPQMHCTTVEICVSFDTRLNTAVQQCNFLLLSRRIKCFLEIALLLEVSIQLSFN